MKLDVVKICGEDVISRDAGKKFRATILENWETPILEVLIGKTPIGSASFFDEAFALLLKRNNKSIEEVKAKLKFPDISPGDRKLLNYVMMARMTEQNMRD